MAAYADTRLAALQRSTESGRQEQAEVGGAGRPAGGALCRRRPAGYRGHRRESGARLDPERALWVSLVGAGGQLPLRPGFGNAGGTGQRGGGTCANAGILVHGDNALEALARSSSPHLRQDRHPDPRRPDHRSPGATGAHQDRASERWRWPPACSSTAIIPLREPSMGWSVICRSTLQIIGSVPASPAPSTVSDTGLAAPISAGNYARCWPTHRRMRPTGLPWSAKTHPWPGYPCTIRCGNRQLRSSSGPDSKAWWLSCSPATAVVKVYCWLQSWVSQRFETGQTPQDKLTHVAQLQAEGATVTMIGDGLNDAPVLSQADTSIAMANAADLTRAQADLVMVDADLDIIPTAFRKALQCRRIMLQNFAWAMAYNACAIPLAASGFIAPWAAAVGMSLSSLLVVGNSLRLNRLP